MNWKLCRRLKVSRGRGIKVSRVKEKILSCKKVVGSRSLHYVSLIYQFIEGAFKGHITQPSSGETKSETARARTAINASRDQQRSEKRRRDREATVLASDVDSRTDGPGHIVSDDAANELLRQLADGQREVATMFYVEDRSVDHIATALGVSVGTVKSQLSEARRRLRRLAQQ